MSRPALQSGSTGPLCGPATGTRIALSTGMVPRVLACDFDGTLASDDRIAPATADALRRARRAGLRLVLVSGRTFFDLVRVCERIDLFDAVVAENGAVLHLPSAATICDEGPPPPRRLLGELDRRGIPYELGRVIVSVARRDEPEVRQALDATGVHRDLCYNRAALMLLPSGITKGRGLSRALGVLNVSFHDVLAIGDAENDLDLFDACEFTACPENAVEELRARADWVFPGVDGSAIAAAIDGPILRGALAVGQSPRHRIHLGWMTRSSEPVTVPSRGANLLVAGDTASGKSWLAGALAERLIAERFAVCAIDPEGDYGVLGALPGVHQVRGTDAEPIQQMLTALRGQPTASVVLDLSGLPHHAKLEAIGEALVGLRALRRELGRPHWILVDEAHYALHPGGASEETADLLRDKGVCLITYRPSWIHKSALSQLDVLLLARTTGSDEIECAAALASGGSADSASLGALLPALPSGEFVELDRGFGAEPAMVTFVPRARQTAHARHLKKYAMAEAPSHRRFFFRREGGPVLAEAAHVHELGQMLGEVPSEVVDEHAGRGDFSRWVGDVFADHRLAAAVRKLEVRRSRGELEDLQSAVRRLIAARYGDVRPGGS